MRVVACGFVWMCATWAKADVWTGVKGTVLDASNREALIEATVTALTDPPVSVLTDVDGHYRLSLKPGTYQIKIFYPLYKTQNIGHVVVDKNAVKLDVQLKPDAGSVQEVVVEARADKGSQAARLQARKESAVVSDGISAEEMARAPAGSASDVARRVVSATVVDGRYMFVRGLGGRYSNALLNGVYLPSPEPDVQAIPLDLFPSQFLSNLTVLKTYTPDLPGAFGGGVLMIESRAYPEKRIFELRVGGSFDSVTTGRLQPYHKGGSWDFLGIDDGTRALPSSVPKNSPVRLGAGGLTLSDVEKTGEAFQQNWVVKEHRALPNGNVMLQWGDTFKWSTHRLGVYTALNYQTRTQTRRVNSASLRVVDNDLGVREIAHSVTGTQTTQWGGLLNVGLEWNANHSVALLSFFTQNAEQNTQVWSGYSETDSQNIESQRMQFISRRLMFNQISGDHRWKAGPGVELKWQGNVAFTHRDEPDTRDLQRDVLSDGRRRFQNGPGSGERLFSGLDEWSRGGAGHVTVPWRAVTLKTGLLAQNWTRSFSARRFRYVFVGQDPQVLNQETASLFTDQTIGPDFRLEERTLQADAYKAHLNIAAGYAMLESTFFKKVRVVGGGRYEYSTQVLNPGSAYAVTQTPEKGVDRNDHAFLPSVNVSYGLNAHMNLKAAYAYTATRPHMRELAPFLYVDFARRRSVSGNPQLSMTRIHHADLRWEMFPKVSSVLSATVYYKKFENPVEQVIVNATQGDASFKNAAHASSVGVELEARSALDVLHPVLKELQAGVNASWIYSKVDLGESAGPQTNLTRPLQGQSPYIVNADLTWMHAHTQTQVSLVYNVSGKRISDVGFDGLPDVYEKPFHRLDVNVIQVLGKGFSLRASVGNVANQKMVFEQGGVSVLSYRPGVVGALSLLWDPFSPTVVIP